jgi:uncharacterized protein YdiU (UPF0061 family)
LSGDTPENARAEFSDPAQFDAWLPRWQSRILTTDRVARMQAANPAFIPRNHRVEEAIAAAVGGDFAPFERLTAVLAHPFDDQPDHADLMTAPAPEEIVQATFCGT